MAAVSRRTAVAGGIAALGLAAVASAVAAIAPETTMGSPAAARVVNPAMEPAAVLARSRFAPHVGETFSLERAGVRTPAVLAAIHDLPQSTSATDEQRFLLELHPESELTDGIFELQHPSAGDATLFISPFGSGARVARLQAVIDQSV